MSIELGNLRFRQVWHPRDKFIDYGSIELVERFKESEISGDEWRFNYVTRLHRKGLVVAKALSGDPVQGAVLLAHTPIVTGKPQVP